MKSIKNFTIARHGWKWAVYTKGATVLCGVFDSISQARNYVNSQG